MIRALKVGLLIERTNRKNLVALLTVVVVVFGMMIFINAQEVGQQLDEKKSDFYNARSVLSKFQVNDASENGDGSDLYKNLTKQKSSIALQIAGLTMDNYPMYYEASLNIAELRKEAFDMEGYEKVADLLPTKLENTLNYIYYKHLVDSKTQGITDISQYIPFLLYFFSIAGFGWYIFISFYTSAILLDDFEHPSIMKGYPVRFDQYIISKCIIAFGYVLAFIALIFICALVSLKNGFGNFDLPVPVYGYDMIAQEEDTVVVGDTLVLIKLTGASEGSNETPTTADVKKEETKKEEKTNIPVSVTVKDKTNDWTIIAMPSVLHR